MVVTFELVRQRELCVHFGPHVADRTRVEFFDLAWISIYTAATKSTAPITQR